MYCVIGGYFCGSFLGVIVYNKCMEGLIIKIGWEYFLGIMASLIAVAWYSNGRFTKLEISMEWARDILKEIKTSSDNETAKAFGPGSPVDLKPVGIEWLKDSGLEEYIESNKTDLLSSCSIDEDNNPYEVQERSFDLFDNIKFEKDFEESLKKFAYEKGTTMDVMRRVGGIYLRNICLDHLGMKKEDIETHDPGASLDR